MRYAIWSGAATGINMPSSMARARHILDVREGWRKTLRKLCGLPNSGAVLEAKITQLEVNCHGTPGRLHLPTRQGPGVVDHTSVEEFGGMLRPSLASGALIELLACKVALLDARINWKARARDERGITSDYHPTDPAIEVKPGHYSDSVLTEYFGAYDRDAAPGTSMFPAAAMAERIAMVKQYEWPDEGNGLRFCQRLASSSGGIVRASDLPQVETRYSDARHALDTIGDWEGHVWDFYPDGRVKYLGYNLPRTQGRIVYDDGDRSGWGGRPMGRDRDDPVLRNQRLNRTPLPA